MRVCRMDCPYCGANIEADVENRKIVYCTYCGKQIRIENDLSNITINQNININQNVNQRVTNDAEILKEQNRHRENRWVLIIASVLLLIFVGGVSILLLRKNSSATVETYTTVREEKEKTTEKKEKPTLVKKEEKASSDNQPVKNETGTAYNEESTSSSDQDKHQIELLDSGYTVETRGSYVVINYAVKINNPNKEYAVEYPHIRITARSADGAILKTDEQVLSFMDADETILYAGEVLYEGKAPNSVDISVSNPDYGFRPKNGDKSSQSQLVISNLSVNRGSYDRTFTGEITNNSKEDLTSVSVIIIFIRGGKMVGGDHDYADNVRSGSTVPFEVRDRSSIEYDSYEVYGLPW